MSGPDLTAPLPGSNAIGLFQIGISPIGTIKPFNFWDTVISQYANSVALTTLISDFDDYIDQTFNFDQFFDLIWNVNTAEGVGLDIWGRIVGVTRILQIAVPSSYLGFEEAVPGSNPFDQAPFYSGAPITSNFALTDSAFRVLIFAKALANITDGSIKSINQLLLSLFPNRGNAYVADGRNMTLTYTFSFPLSPVELAIIEQSGVLPKSTGVQALISQAL